MTLNENEVWVLIAGLVATTFLIKAAGPVLVGGRELPAPFLRVVALAAPPLLAALIVTNVLTDGRHVGVGADTVGVAVGTVLLVCRMPLVVAAVVAVVVTAALRALV